MDVLNMIDVREYLKTLSADFDKYIRNYIPDEDPENLI